MRLCIEDEEDTNSFYTANTFYTYSTKNKAENVFGMASKSVCDYANVLEY